MALCTGLYTAWYYMLLCMRLDLGCLSRLVSCLGNCWLDGRLVFKCLLWGWVFYC